MVSDRLLPRAAVGECLGHDLPAEDLAALPAPAAGRVQAREVARRHEHARRLADEVVVGGGAARVPPDDLPCLEVDGGVDACPKLTGHQRGLPDEVQAPDPVDQPDGELERAQPVHAQPEGALAEPGVHLLQQGLGIAALAARPVGPSEHHEMLVAVGLPDHLGVPRHVVVPIVDPAGEAHRRRPAALVVAVPVDGIAEVAVLHAKEAETVGGDAVRPAQEPAEPGALFGPGAGTRPLAHGHVGHPEARFAAVKKSRRRAGMRAHRQSASVEDIAAEAVRSPDQLRAGHAPQTAQVPGGGLHGFRPRARLRSGAPGRPRIAEGRGCARHSDGPAGRTPAWPPRSRAARGAPPPARGPSRQPFPRRCAR